MAEKNESKKTMSSSELIDALKKEGVVVEVEGDSCASCFAWGAIAASAAIIAGKLIYDWMKDSDE